MSSEDNIYKMKTEKKLILAPGAADISEGAVCLDEENTLPCKKVAGVFFTGEKSHNIPGEKHGVVGFWSVAPGSADVSEGMVWVAAMQQNQARDHDIPLAREVQDLPIGMTSAAI